MAENITTLLELLDAGELSENDLIYIVHGSGSNRDRKLKLSRLQLHCAKVIVNNEDDFPATLSDKFSLSDSPEHRHGDIWFSVIDTRGGKQLSTTIRDNRITTAMLKDNAVTGDKIANSAITSDKIWNVSGDNIDFSASKGSKSVTITGGGSASTVLADVTLFNPVYYRGFYDFTIGFKNITTYPLSHAVVKLFDRNNNLVDSFDFSGYTDQEWHYGRIVGRYAFGGSEDHSNLYLKLEGDTNFSGSRSPQVSWRGYVIP